MAIEKLHLFTTNVENITPLPDSPISTELTSDDLKKLFDKAGKDIKAYINDDLKDFCDTVANTVDSIVAQELPDNAVTTVKIRDSNVTTVKIQNSAITDSKIATSAVSAAKIADGCITSAKIASSAITNAKINSVAATKITGTLSTSHGGYTYEYWKQNVASDSNDFKARYIKISSSAPSGSADAGQIWLQIIST